MNEHNHSIGEAIVKRVFLAVAAFGVLSFIGTVASAGTIIVSNPTDFFFQGEPTQFKMTNYENVYDSSGNTVNIATTPVVAGDVLHGIFNITSVQDQSGNVKYPSGFQLTGIFDALISSVSGLNSTLVPDPSFSVPGGSPGTMVAVYNNTGSFTATGTIASTEASATAGTLWMTLGAPTGNSVWGTNYYWADVGSSTPGLSSFAASLGLLNNNTGVPTAQFALMNQFPPADFGMPALGSILNASGLQGITSPISIPGIPYVIQSQDPLTMSVVPEPSSLGLLGAFFGVLAAGLAAYRRKVKE